MDVVIVAGRACGNRLKLANFERGFVRGSGAMLQFASAPCSGKTLNRRCADGDDYDGAAAYSAATTGAA
jgi:hypothetical protein